MGFAEHITSDIGSLGDFAAGAETAFGTVLQRCYAFLGGRMHYGHPDMMNKEFMMQQGGVSKATKTVNLSEATPFAVFRDVLLRFHLKMAHSVAFSRPKASLRARISRFQAFGRTSLRGWTSPCGGTAGTSCTASISMWPKGGWEGGEAFETELR